MSFQRLLACIFRISFLTPALSLALAAQTETPVSTAPAPPVTNGTAADQSAAPVMKVTTRLVSLEVVARDRQGRPVPGLTAKDFEVTEQLLPKKERRPQSISVFRAVNWNELKKANENAMPLPPGVYSNLANSAKVQAPPTVLLFDGINTDLDSQLQVHRQMAGILNSIPVDVPVAVFLMGDHLRLLQTFTTDPKLLREAAAKTLVVGQTSPDKDPMDNPDALSAQLENLPSNILPAGALASLQSFEQQMFSFMVGMRVQKTLDALRGISRYLDGYPGRKNIIWISTSFPLVLSPPGDSASGGLSDLRVFQGDMQEVGLALMEGKIAIYPVDAGGVRTQSMFEASARVRQPQNGQRMGQALQREDVLRQGAQQVMRDLADETGGRVCIGDNDFADCVKKAVDDASSYYELAYYPEGGDWRGEYHRISIKTNHSGVHLWYREGYYAQPLGNVQSTSVPVPQQADPGMRKAACEDPLPATAILLMVKPVPPDQPGAAKYFLAIDPRMVTFTAPRAGVHELGISVAACTFDKTGQPLQYLQKNSLSKLDEGEFAVAAHGITQTFQFDPNPGAARVRLLVHDSVSGRIGSVDIPYPDAGSSARQ